MKADVQKLGIQQVKIETDVEFNPLLCARVNVIYT